MTNKTETNEILIHEAMKAISNYDFEGARFLLALLITEKGEKLYTCKKVIELSSDEELIETANKWFKCAL